jgi:hypothetical protein
MNKIDNYRKTLNDLKTKVVASGRYLEQVYNTGFDTYEQFQSFINMCENHVDMCNTYCNKYKPTLWFIPTQKTKIYANFRNGCSWSVDIINTLVKSWQTSYEVAMEDAKIKSQIEERARIEHEIAIEYAENQYEKNRKADAKPVIGFKSNIAKPKKKRTNKKKQLYE